MIKEMFKKKEETPEGNNDVRMRDPALPIAEEGASGSPGENETPVENETPAQHVSSTDNENAAENATAEEKAAPAGKANAEEKASAVELERAYCLGAGIDGETLGKAKQLLGELGVAQDTFNPKALRAALMMLGHDAEIEEARKRGYEAGRAEAMAEARQSRKTRVREAAAIPALHGFTQRTGAEGASIFDIARGTR